MWHRSSRHNVAMKVVATTTIVLQKRGVEEKRRVGGDKRVNSYSGRPDYP